VAKKILIVDDSEMVRSFYYYVLKNAGFEVKSAMDGVDGLEKLLQNPDMELVITDINMPNMDGYSMIERIREDPQFETIPIIIISTEQEASDKQRGFDAGADIYVVKPVEPSVLIENVRILLGV